MQHLFIFSDFAGAQPLRVLTTMKLNEAETLILQGDAHREHPVTSVGLCKCKGSAHSHLILGSGPENSP